MGKDFLGWSKWSPHVGNAITIILGIPAVLGAAAAGWAWLAPSRGLVVTLVGVGSFMVVLWCCIGVAWLLDRNAKVNLALKRELNCEWGITVDCGFLNFDPSGQIACQVTVALRNLLDWPIRCEIVYQSCNVDAITPNKQVMKSPPAIIPQGGTIMIAFDGYSSGTIPHKLSYTGKIDLRVKYGHPEIGMSREMARFYTFALQLQPNPMQAFLSQNVPSGTKTPLPQTITGMIPLSLSNAQQEEDKPL